MQLYDFNKHHTTEHTLPVDVYSGYIQVDRTTVLIVGKEVLTLDLLTLQVTPLASLLTPRDCVGVAQVDNTVFAFGGWEGCPMTVCEKSSVPITSWTSLRVPSKPSSTSSLPKLEATEQWKASVLSLRPSLCCLSFCPNK